MAPTQKAERVNSISRDTTDGGSGKESASPLGGSSPGPSGRLSYSPASSTKLLPALVLLQHQRATAEMLENSPNSSCDGRKRRAMVTASVVLLVLMGALVMDTVTEARKTADEAAPLLNVQVCAQLSRISGGGDLPAECKEFTNLTDDELADVAADSVRESSQAEVPQKRKYEPLTWLISKALRDPVLRALKRKVSSEVAAEDEQLRQELSAKVAAGEALAVGGAKGNGKRGASTGAKGDEKKSGKASKDEKGGDNQAGGKDSGKREGKKKGGRPPSDKRPLTIRRRSLRPGDASEEEAGASSLGGEEGGGETKPRADDRRQRRGG